MKSFKKLLGVVVALVLCVAMTIPTLAAPAEGFTDVEDGAWYESAVERWTDAGLFKGYEDGSFGTDGNITRAEVATVVQRLLDLKTPDAPAKTFTDVTTADWYYDYVMACANSEPAMLNGYGTTFGPNDPIKREDAFKILVTALIDESAMVAEGDIDATLANFADAASVDSWADEHVATLVKMGILTGYNNNGVYTLKPTQNITRAEFATILNRLIAIYVYVDETTGETVVSEYAAPASEPDVEIDASQNTSVVLVVNAEENDIVVEVKTVEDAATGETKDVVVVSKVVEDAATGETVKEELASADVADDEEVLVVSSTTTTTDENTTVGKLPVQKDETIVVTPTITYSDEYDNCAAGGVRYEVTTTGADVTKEKVKDLAPKVHNMLDGVCKDCGMKAADAMKFNVKVSSNGNYVEANVTNDYAATLTVTPGKVSAKEVTLSATMQDVASLGGGTRHHEDTFTTNMTGDPSLSTWLSNVFTFEEGYIEVTGLGEEMIGYTLEGTPQVKGDDGYYPEAAVITATPYDVEDTRDAWAELTSHVTTSDQTDSDSYVNIANGSYMIVGDDKLCFEKGTDEDLTLDNFSDLDAMEKEIRSKVQLITNSAFESDDYEAKFYLAAGTELAVSNSIATLDDNCTITVSGEGLNSDDFQDVLTNIRDAESTYDMATELVNMINAMVGSADGETIYVDFEFTTPVEKDSKFYLGMTANNADGNGTTTVDMEVYDDYSLEINLPMNKLSAQEVTLSAEMTNVGSLGVEGTRSHSQTINTGMTATGDLNTWMSNAPLFETATINAKIVTPDGTFPCTYVLESDMDADWVTITGTTNTAEARAAWQALTSHVETYTQDESDSYFFIAGDSFIDTTAEKLVMEETAQWNGLNGLCLDNFSNIAELKQNIKDSVYLTTSTEDSITLHVGAGSQLAVSNSVAFTTADTTITIKGVEVSGTLLSDIREAANGSTEALVKELFNILNEAVGAMNGKTVDVTVTIGEAEALG